MRSSLAVADCPECRATGTVIVGTDGVCCACFAEFRQDEYPQLWLDEPPLSDLTPVRTDAGFGDA